MANIAVDEALDTSGGLPAASGNNFTLNGTFAIAVSFAGEDSSLPQPQNNALILLSAFKASVGEPGSASRAALRRISFTDLHGILRRLGLR